MNTEGQRSKKQKELTDRRRQVAMMMMRHLDQQDIIKQLNALRAKDGLGDVSQPTISRDMKAVQQQWQRETVEMIGTIKERELAELSDMERSCAIEFEKTRDVRWIAERRAIKERRAKSLGLDAPTKIEVRDWRENAKQKGIDAGSVFECMIQQFATELKSTVDANADD